jgi:lysozyme
MRLPIKALSAGAALLVAVATFEGYKDRAYIPVAGDVPTIGFGSTKGVKLGDTTTPDRALVVLLHDLNTHSNGIKACITVPLYQHEFDAYSSFAFNVGVSAFCKSTLVKKLNAGDYTGACNELPKWVYSGGKKYNGLVKRREQERKLCLGY